ncbi:esterase AGAP003155-like [Agrilus planipennis]|uniref:Esterase AGAP003155 n=1 Tax=Agrilus planipennis TaxID=224129 RepID=A0A1W4WJH6_AGRPL|nr:esterase AGAP003155 [Agrilus planipennis]XP_025832467.1 esterase AGAP003155-like [Agrilus planipennis]
MECLLPSHEKFTCKIFTFENKAKFIICSGNNMSPENSGEKLKILALHGYRQNGETFRQKTGSFRKTVQKWAQFTYITAPHKVVNENNEKEIVSDVGDGTNEEQYSWWFNKENNSFRGTVKGGPAVGFEESLILVEKAFKEFGPFDGILGFSQGACFVGILCSMQQLGLLSYHFSFAIMAAGFPSYSLPHVNYYSDKIKLPSLHIFGEQDDIIPRVMSEELRDIFENPVTVIHPGKHYLPASAPQKQPYQSFIKKIVLQKQSTSA